MKNYENSDINILKFPTGPLVGAGPGISFGSAQLSFRQDLKSNFLIQYKEIVEKNKYSSFISSQRSILEILADKAYEILVNPTKNTAKNKYTFEVVKRETERQLLTLQLVSASASLRTEINTFAMSHESSKKIDLGTMIGIPLAVELTQDDLINADFIYMTDIDIDYTGKDRISSPIIQDRVELLTKAIQAFHSDGRVKIIPMVDFTDSLLGTQFLQPRATKSSLHKFKQLPKGTGYFEVDVQTTSGRRTLEYISYLLNYHMSNSFSTISFLVKSANGELSDGKGDFFITRDGIFEAGEIYSPRLSAQVERSFADDYMTDLIQMRFDDYYVSTVQPTILGEIIEIKTEEYINIINDVWNLIPKSLIIYDNDLSKYIRPKYLDLLNNPYLTN
ncbi:hypothetical protein LCGC14_1633930 [marine sediment metagenome]|uniref:Uncharacterized protein n=1 Tax=marine sediment metagenome TaxID=412755 RepID=A0A0F9I254_9ZZZZ